MQVHVSTSQGKPFWAPIFDPQPCLQVQMACVALCKPATVPGAETGCVDKVRDMRRVLAKT